MSYTNSVKSVVKVTGLPKECFHMSGPQKISLKDKSAFSLPAGPEFSCPGATEACKGCYAMKGRHVFKNVQSAFVRNWKELHKYRKQNNLEQAMLLLQYSIPASRDIFRIHESGDFFAQWYVDLWASVIKNRPDVKFWSYTRSFHYNYSKMLNCENMRLWASTDEYNLKEAEKFVKRYESKGVKHAFGPVEHNQKIPDGSFACPVTSGKLTINGACEECMLCVNKKTNKHVVFFKH